MIKSQPFSRTLDALVLLVLALFGLWQLAPGLGHPSITSWDEAAHQAVTRGLHDTGLPVIYREPLVPIADNDWMGAHVFLHKPTLPFALGALSMVLLGPTPLALRSVSLLAALLAAWALYALGREALGRGLAFACAAAWLTLPFGFELVQGYQFGDVTDCALAGFLSLSMWLLWAAVRRDSAPLATLGGIACAAAYLSKSALALTPLGVAVGLYVLGIVGRSPPLRARLLWAFGGAALITAAPWNLYCAWRWPALFRFEAAHTLSHLTGEQVAWNKPIDAIFNQINAQELQPWPVALVLIAGGWLLWSAFRQRDLTRWLLALWLWGSWVPLSLAPAKVPATAWGAAPAVLLAVGVCLRDGWRLPALAGAALGALATPFWPGAVKALGMVRTFVPAALAQTAVHPGLAEGVLAAAIAAGVGWLFSLGQWHARARARLLGGGALALAGFVGVVQSAAALAAVRTAHAAQALESYSDLLGPALDHAVPARSVLFSGLDRDPPCCFETQSLMFYSGRMVYPRTPGLEALARARGDHPYLISGHAEPFARVGPVPAGAWLQAYDLDQPLAHAAPPPALYPEPLRAGPWTVLGAAVSAGDVAQDRYVFYVKGPVPVPPAQVELMTASGVRRESLGAQRQLSAPGRLAPVDWYTLTSPGPRRSQLVGLTFDGVPLPLP